MSDKKELGKENLENVSGAGNNSDYTYKVGDKVTIYKNSVGYSCTVVQRGKTMNYWLCESYRVSCPSNKDLEGKWYCLGQFHYEFALNYCTYPE